MFQIITNEQLVKDIENRSLKADISKRQLLCYDKI